MFTYNQSIYEQLREYIGTLTIIDTHEHLPARESDRNQECDVFGDFLFHYFSCDLVSAGLPNIADIKTGKSLTVADKWKQIEPYWQYARYTGYARSLELAARDIYGVDTISADTIEELDTKFRLARSAGGHYERVLKELSKIEVSILDHSPNFDPRYFYTVLKSDDYLGVSSEDADKYSFDEYLEKCTREFDYGFAHGCKAFKSVAAYHMGLDFPDTTRERASELYKSREFDTEFAGFMLNFMLGYANEHNLAFQFHTGLQEGNGNMLNKSNPLHLNRLFFEYPNVKFDIFHIGYPFWNIPIALSKNFSNVYIDMCWAHIISPMASVNMLLEALDTLPFNKISAFGGDYCFVDGVYGHQYIARDNVAKALAIKVNTGVFDLEAAKFIAKTMFYDNPKRIFKL